MTSFAFSVPTDALAGGSTCTSQSQFEIGFVKDSDWCVPTPHCEATLP